MRLNRKYATTTTWLPACSRWMTGILFIVLAFCFGIGAHYANGRDMVYVSIPEEAIATGQSSDSITENNTQKSFTYKIKVKKKLKVRYRAMYCNLRLSPKVAIKRILVVSACTVFSGPGDFLHDRFAYSFTLRGPPTATA